MLRECEKVYDNHRMPEGGREAGGREGREGGREGGRDGGMEGGREGGMEGGRDEGGEGGERMRGKDGGENLHWYQFWLVTNKPERKTVVC